MARPMPLYLPTVSIALVFTSPALFRPGGRPAPTESVDYGGEG